MKKIIAIAVMLATSLSFLQARGSDVLIIGDVMYQNQAFSARDKQIFDADIEGSRVWNWHHANRYCRRLHLNGYSDWRLASTRELTTIMNRTKGRNGLYAKPIFKMPATGGKYDNVWMWAGEAVAEPNSLDSHIGSFVNFKKNNRGNADMGYKGYVICTRSVKLVHKHKKRAKCKKNRKQEQSKSKNWIKAWKTCSGYTALKKDGTLWQFGKVGECGWGQINPINLQTGKPLYNIKKIYYLKPKKIGQGFRRAKFFNGGYRMYAIKSNGTLWGWGEGLGAKAKKLSKSRNWSYFAIKYAGNGCCSYDIGLKKDGTLWRIPELAFAQGRYKRPLKIEKISNFSDWKKIVLGCCNIYGLRKNGTMWRFSQTGNEKPSFKRFTPKKKSYGCDIELYRVLKSKMAKVKRGTIYSQQPSQAVIRANKDGTLCLPAIKN